MGLVIVLVLWLVVGAVLAAIGATTLAGIAGILFVLPPIVGVLVLIRWIVRLRRSRVPLPRAA